MSKLSKFSETSAESLSHRKGFNLKSHQSGSPHCLKLFQCWPSGETLTVLYLQGGPPNAESKPNSHRTRRTLFSTFSPRKTVCRRQSVAWPGGVSVPRHAFLKSPRIERTKRIKPPKHRTHRTHRSIEGTIVDYNEIVSESEFLVAEGPPQMRTDPPQNLSFLLPIGPCCPQPSRKPCIHSRRILFYGLSDFEFEKPSHITEKSGNSCNFPVFEE
jgi:hypothetical protein